MNIEERLSNLMLTRGLNKSQLSKQANIPYTTIDGMFKKGAHNIKLSTLIKLADFFNVSIDYLVGRSNPSDEQDLKMFEDYLKYRREHFNG